jgi:hypothetical protein
MQNRITRMDNSTWKKKVPRGKNHNETATKKTVSLYLSRKLVERARNHNLNLSRVTENALNNILSQIEPQNNHFSLSEGSLSGKRESSWWTERELNPRPPECKSGIHSRLNYRPPLFFALFDDRS